MTEAWPGTRCLKAHMSAKCPITPPYQLDAYGRTAALEAADDRICLSHADTSRVG